jgi:hypothetical protein
MVARVFSNFCQVGGLAIVQKRKIEPNLATGQIGRWQLFEIVPSSGDLHI